MKDDLKEAIIALAQPASPTPEQEAELIAGWQEYFTTCCILEENQKDEFARVVKLRLNFGIISILPETNDLTFFVF